MKTLRISTRRSGETGSVMWIVLLVLLVLSASATTSFERQALVEKESRLERARFQALQAAEGALEIARHRRALGEPLPTLVQVGRSTCTLEVREASEQGARIRQLRVRAATPGHSGLPPAAQVLEVRWD